MKRFAILLYGMICYVVFFGTFLYALGFIGNFVVPKSIDSGIESRWPTAITMNLFLLGAFAVQHSLMARTHFKNWLTQHIPQSAERSTYVISSSIAFILLFWGWHPITGTIFTIEGEIFRIAINTFFFMGAGLVLYSTFLIDHFDLLGLRQVYLQFRRRPYTDKKFATPSLYKYVRHPLYIGWFIVFWATPELTVGHLIMAIAMTGYTLGAILFEERDLLDALGPDYRAYRERTPMFFPNLSSHFDNDAKATERAATQNFRGP